MRSYLSLNCFDITWNFTSMQKFCNTRNFTISISTPLYLCQVWKVYLSPILHTSFEFNLSHPLPTNEMKMTLSMVERIRVNYNSGFDRNTNKSVVFLMGQVIFLLVSLLNFLFIVFFLVCKSFVCMYFRNWFYGKFRVCLDG